MGLCVLYYAEYSLYHVKKVGFFLSGLELHFEYRSKPRYKFKVPIAPNYKGVYLQNTSKSHLYHLKIRHLL